MQLYESSGSGETPRSPDTVQIDSAIATCIQALKVISPSRNPTEWANVQFELAMLYLQRTHEDITVNHECAIQAFVNAMPIYNSKDYPEKWAFIMLRLALLYTERGEGKAAENIVRAIRYIEKALTFYQPDRDPIEWIECQRALGKVFLKLSQMPRSASRIAHRQRALSHYMSALALVKRDELPVLWHLVHFELYLLFKDKDVECTEENKKEAEKHYQCAFDFEHDDDYKDAGSILRLLEEEMRETDDLYRLRDDLRRRRDALTTFE
jgi:tetratricopeptide (TPR) repeat protein